MYIFYQNCRKNQLHNCFYSLTRGIVVDLMSKEAYSCSHTCCIRLCIYSLYQVTSNNAHTMNDLAVLLFMHYLHIFKHVHIFRHLYTFLKHISSRLCCSPELTCKCVICSCTSRRALSLFSWHHQPSIPSREAKKKRC